MVRSEELARRAVRKTSSLLTAYAHGIASYQRHDTIWVWNGKGPRCARALFRPAAMRARQGVTVAVSVAPAYGSQRYSRMNHVPAAGLFMTQLSVLPAFSEAQLFAERVGTAL